jgi:5'-deoxynucleotidase YfbR-like HD superfamily hydrolase
MLDKSLIRNRLARIRRGGEVARFHTERTIHENTVGEHSFNVAWLVNLLAPTTDFQRRYYLVLAALSHDLAEETIGDVPAPTKRALNIRELFGKYEEQLLEEVGLSYEKHLPEEDKRVLKLADALDGAFFCIGEVAMGNRRMSHVYQNFRRYVSQFEPFSSIETEVISYVDELWQEYSR